MMIYKFRFLARRLPDTSIARGVVLLVVACLLIALTAIAHAARPIAARDSASAVDGRFSGVSAQTALQAALCAASGSRSSSTLPPAGGATSR